MYEILKDFAGPVATIIASITAAGITWYFASRQAQIAQQQADTAKQQGSTGIFLFYGYLCVVAETPRRMPAASYIAINTAFTGRACS